MASRWTFPFILFCVCLLVPTLAAVADDEDLTWTGAPPGPRPILASDVLGPPPAGAPLEPVAYDGEPAAEDEAPAPAADAGDPPLGDPPAESPVDEVVAEPIAEDVREVVVVDEPAECERMCRTVELCCGQVYDECGWALDSCNRPYGRWEVRLEGAASLTQDPEGLLGPATGLANQMNWDALSYDFAFGGRAGLQYAVTPRDRVALTGTYYGSFDDSVRQTGVLGFSTVPGGPVLATPANTATLTTEADVFGGELHWWHEMCAWQCVRWDLGVGARMLVVDETATADNWALPFPPLVGLPFVQAEAKNTFLGGQVGAAIYYDHDRRWTFFGSVKALAGALNRDIEVTDRNIFIGGAHAASDEETAFAWGVDVEVGLRWRLSRSVLLGVSYNLLFLDNVVHATDAMDFTQSATGAVQAQQLEDDMLVHAVFAGFTLNL